MKSGIRGFEDLEVWRRGVDLAAQVYNVTREWRDWGLRDQLQRSAVSIPSNIAEGYDRRSNKEFVQFLKYSRGSAAELRTQLIVAVRAGAIEAAKAAPLIEETRILSAQLHCFAEVRKAQF